MAVTNTDEKVDAKPKDEAETDTVDDGKIDEDLKKLKEDSKVEPQQADETPKPEESEEESEETEEDSKDETEESFVKEFPNIKGDTPEEYAKNLEDAYKNSTTEALRLKREAEAETKDDDDETPSDPRLLYLDQMLQKDITDSFETFSKSYPQTKDPAEYDKFQTEASNLSQYIIQTQKRVAPASELYSKVAAILGWKPEDVIEDKDKLDAALKDKASQSKTTSATKPKSTSKITDSQISIAKQMGGWTEGKSDAEIRKELEAI